MASAATVTVVELRRVYGAAVAHGQASTLCAVEQERSERTLGLLALAAVRLPDLVLYAHLVQAFDEDARQDGVPDAVSEGLLRVCAGTLRLAHRALEVHGRTVGFCVGAWVDRGLERAYGNLSAASAAEPRVLIDEARGAALALTGALGAIEDDRMLVCEQLAAGIAHLLGIYVIASAIC